MKPKSLEFNQAASLETFAKKCAKTLLSNPPMEIVKFPLDCSATNWCQITIKELNEGFLGKLRNNGNVYALFLEAEDLTKWEPRYVGKSARSNLRTRISNHLIGKHEKTGSKLDEVRQAVLAGRKIGISYILVEPEELRGYVEEKLIPLVEGWNYHAAKKR
ncbi:hypothetical protein QFZ83_002179 [Variovorax sp. W1I1]|uniref:GIY-YIG nuclease family protein n=1 Tax=Variovorax sp. W1I1 TaxID=3042309 RepID=UPI002786C46E|nr:GIY-YIG nuclease family protein [Variovorax sp. W1I1]MDQ0608008.1 hypothetical protein [Variovorax sp. W1I1]